MKWVSVVLVVGMGLVGLARAAQAQTETPSFKFYVSVSGHGGHVAGSPSDLFLTFSGPVEIPRVTLPAGTYLFRTIAPSVVQVLSPDRRTLYTTFFTSPASRARPVSHEQVRFQRIRDDAPIRMIAWYPGDWSGFSSTGYQLIYPKWQRASVATQVAAR
jgi:hypothetical protein